MLPARSRSAGTPGRRSTIVARRHPHQPGACRLRRPFPAGRSPPCPRPAFAARRAAAASAYR